jgi:hypothetical protein
MQGTVVLARTLPRCVFFVDVDVDVDVDVVELFTILHHNPHEVLLPKSKQVSGMESWVVFFISFSSAF